MHKHFKHRCIVHTALHIILLLKVKYKMYSIIVSSLVCFFFFFF